MRPEPLCAQVTKPLKPKDKAALQTPAQPTPATPAPVSRQLSQPDTAAQAVDTIRVSAARKGGVETTINYSARDSIRFDVVSKIMYLYGDGKIDYGQTSLTAEQIQINWETSTLTANGVPDSSGKLIGTPFFKDGEEQYQAEKIAYNYKTKRGKISGAITKQGEGYIHAETVKKNADNELFGQNAQYTTCDLEHPHFFINASKMKVDPGRKVITGPFNLWVGDIPTPVGFLFGLFPTPKKRSSGVIIPTFGETTNRGFYLRNGGYYWAVNDYLGMRFLGDVYSLGGYGVSAIGDYYKRYSYRGNFSLQYTKTVQPEILTDASADVGPGVPFQPEENSVWVRWTHSPETLRPGGGRFSASVEAGSSSFNTLNATDMNNYLGQTFQSSIRYSRTLPYAPISYDITARHSQNIQTGIMVFNLPDISVSTNSLYPFRSFTEVPQGRWYEDFTNQFYFTYNLNLQNQFTNKIGNDTLSFGRNLNTILSNGLNGAQHRFNISLGSYKLLKYLNFSPSVNYSESWQLKRLTYDFDETAGVLDTDTLSKFSRVYDYGASASLSTQIYGMYNVKGKKIEAIRHLVTPSLAYNFRPEFGDPRYDFYQNVQVDKDGTFARRSRYAGLLYGAPSPERQSALALGLNNSIEMKIKSKTDTVETFKKVKLIESLRLNTSYNFAADSFKLNDLNAGLTTNLFDRIASNASANFSPYQFREGRRIDAYQFNSGGFSLFNFTSATLDVSTDLNPDNWKRETRTSANTYAETTQFPTETTFPAMGAMPEYVDFDVKWTLWLGYYISYINPRFTQNDSFNQAQNITVRGSVNPTNKWKIQFTSGFDLTKKDITVTSIDIYRDLHCWEMSIGWRPFGLSQGYFINVNVKSSMLRDLKLSKNETYRNRF